jgi:hypothetical protein
VGRLAGPKGGGGGGGELTWPGSWAKEREKGRGGLSLGRIQPKMLIKKMKLFSYFLVLIQMNSIEIEKISKQIQKLKHPTIQK